MKMVRKERRASERRERCAAAEGGMWLQFKWLWPWPLPQLAVWWEVVEDIVLE